MPCGSLAKKKRKEKKMPCGWAWTWPQTCREMAQANLPFSRHHPWSGDCWLRAAIGPNPLVDSRRTSAIPQLTFKTRGNTNCGLTIVVIQSTSWVERESLLLISWSNLDVVEIGKNMPFKIVHCNVYSTWRSRRRLKSRFFRIVWVNVSFCDGTLFN